VSSLYEAAGVGWPLVAAIASLFGTSLFALVVAENRGSQRALEVLVSLWRSLAAAVLLLCPLQLLVETAAMAEVSLLQAVPLVHKVLTGTHAGRLFIWQIPLTGLLFAATLARVSVRTRSTMIRSILICALSAAILVLQALGSHAIDHGAVAVAVYVAHELAAGAWLGALAGLVLSGTLGGAPRESIGDAARSVSRIAGASLLVVIVTGLYNGYQALGLDASLLINSLYGRILLWKLATLAPVLMLAGYHRYRVMPAIEEGCTQAVLLRSVAAECALLIAVLGWSALLANSPPPH
jgi:copper resistance protein D